MFKKSLSILLILSIIMICPLTAFAMTATSSDAMRIPVSTSSNAVPFMDDYMESDAFDSLNAPILMSSGDGLVYGTDYVYRARYRNSKNVLKYVNAVRSGGFYKFVSPGSDYWPDLVYAQVYKSGLPSSSGTYGLTATILQGNLDFGDYVTSGFCEIYEAAENVTESSFKNENLSYSNTGESYVIKGNVKSTRYSIRANIGLILKKGVNPTFDISDLSFDFYFKNNEGVPVSGNTGYDSADAVADNTAQQVEQGDTIIELIKNTIQTISSQLTAFWNQLAGEFTNLYNKMSSQHSEQLQADRDNTDDIIASEESNTTNIINNNNANTDKLANGYDSSKLNESGNSLNNKLQEYESAESGINDTASGWLNDFTMPDFDNLVNTGGILSACIWLGSFWQTIFTDMGSFNIPVTLSFTLIFVLMLIGYHRFRR